MKAHVIDQSLNGSIIISYYLLPRLLSIIINRQTYLSFTTTMTDSDWPIRSQIKIASLASRMLGMQKQQIFRLKITHFGCTYLSLHTVYGLDTLGIHLYSHSLLACKVLGKSDIWPKNGQRAPLQFVSLLLYIVSCNRIQLTGTYKRSTFQTTSLGKRNRLFFKRVD